MTNPNCFDDVPGCDRTPAHSHPKGQVFDFYYGGARDGQRWPLDKTITTSEVMAPNGDVYQHHPGFDTPTERAWLVVPSIKPTAASGVHVEPQAGQRFVTLQDLRTLVNAADRMGHAETAVVHARVAWRGQVLTIGIKPEQPESKP